MSGRVRVLVMKEWRELVHRKGLILSTLVMFSLFLFIPFGIGILMPALQGGNTYSDPDLQKNLAGLLRLEPELASLGPVALFEIMIFRQFMLFFLIAPVVSGLSIAAYSIIGEKVGRSLEPLLATPIGTTELLWGKCRAAAIPTVLVSWFFFGLSAIGISRLLRPEVFARVFNATSLGIVFLIAPMIGVLGLSVGIITSSRTTDPRSAQQISVVVVLPLLGIVLSQIFGLFQLTFSLVLGAAAFLALLDVVVLWIGARLFEREAILTRWR